VDTLELDEFSGHVVTMDFRVFKKDFPKGPRTESLRVLVLGRNRRKRSVSWTGLLMDEPHYAPVKLGDQILVMERHLANARHPRLEELDDMQRLYLERGVVETWPAPGGQA